MGTVEGKTTNGAVTAPELDGATLQDLSPLLVFSGLQKLDCSGAGPWQ